jgi:hypothetical protein
MALASKGGEPFMETVYTAQPSADLLAATAAAAGERFANDLHEVRELLAAAYDRAFARLSENQWVPLDSVSTVVDQLSAEATAERERADSLAADLELSRQELESLKVEWQTAMDAAHEAAAQNLKTVTERFERELNAARAAATAAASAETRLRLELSAVQNRFQEILDSQMLQLVTFKRELEQATTRGDRTRRTPETAAGEVGQSGIAVVSKPAPRNERSRNGEIPGFDKIEAILADSPPLGKWPLPTPA